MDFTTAEEKFNDLQARIRRGEPLTEDQYQEELAKLMVQDDAGVFWSLEPGTGRWLYFNGTEWAPGVPPKQGDAGLAAAAAAAAAALKQDDSLYTAPPAYDATTPAPAEPAADPSTYYVPSDVTRPVEYSSAYAAEQHLGEPASPESYVPMGAEGDSDAMPTYVRVPEQEPSNVPTGGIPPRPVREASPLAIPGGERAWLPFAFGALVLLLCAVVLFFGVRGLPLFVGNTAGTSPTEEPTEEVVEVLPTETVIIEPTDAPEPTEAATAAPQPTAAPQQVKATANDVLNVRQGPERTTASLGKLKKGQEAVVVGRNGDGTWLQIEIPADIGTGLGWISAEFSTVSGDTNALPVKSGESGSNPQPTVTETPTG